MSDFKDFLREQLKDPEFATAYKEVSAEIDAEFARTCPNLKRFERQESRDSKMAKETITEAEYLQLLGLMSLAQHHYQWEQRCMRAAKESLALAEDAPFAEGDWLDEVLYGDRTLESALDKIGVTVGWPKSRKPVDEGEVEGHRNGEL